MSSVPLGIKLKSMLTTILMLSVSVIPGSDFMGQDQQAISLIHSAFFGL